MDRRTFMIGAGAAAGMVLLPRMASAEADRIDWYTESDHEHPRFLDQHREAEVRGGQSRRHAEPRRWRRRRRPDGDRRARARRAADQHRSAGRLSSKTTIRACPRAPSRPASGRRLQGGRALELFQDQPAGLRHRLLSLPYRGSQVLLAYDTTKLDPADAPKTWADLVAWIKANPGQFIYNRPDKGGSGGNFVRRAIYRGERQGPGQVQGRQLHAGSRPTPTLDPAWDILSDLASVAVRQGRLYRRATPSRSSSSASPP